MRGAATVVAALVLCACTESPYARMSEQEIHARAQALPLEQRYAFYVDVLESTIPENPVVADDLVSLGPPARQYTLNRAVAGDRTDLLIALPALSAFDARCSPHELDRLRRKANDVALGNEDRRLIRAHIDVACEVATPMDVRNPWDGPTASRRSSG